MPNSQHRSNGYGRFSWKPACTNHLRTKYVACVVPDSIHRNLSAVVNCRQSIFQAMNVRKNARRARRNLEEAVKVDTQNHEYFHELFGFYADSPEWFHGG